jgi:hypothetical protein
MPTFDASTASVHVFTEKEGVLSAVAHDLELAVTDFTITAGEAGVTARFNPRSLTVLHGLKDGKPGTTFSEKERRDLHANLAREVLPGTADLTFSSSSMMRQGAGARLEIAVAGALTVGRVSRPLSFRARAEGADFVAEVRLHQPDFGIKPFSAMLGTLKVKPDVRVRVRLPAW